MELNTRKRSPNKSRPLPPNIELSNIIWKPHFFKYRHPALLLACSLALLVLVCKVHRVGEIDLTTSTSEKRRLLMADDSQVSQPPPPPGVPPPPPTPPEAKSEASDLDYVTRREIGREAVWSLSSAKPGNGVDQLRDDSIETYWQSGKSEGMTCVIACPMALVQRGCSAVCNLDGCMHTLLHLVLYFRVFMLYPRCYF